MSKKLLPPIPETNSLVVYQTPKLHPIKKKRCSHCQEIGHNAATCYHRNRCSECGEKGHNIRTCPDNTIQKNFKWLEGIINSAGDTITYNEAVSMIEARLTIIKELLYGKERE